MAYNILGNDGTEGQVPESREVSQRFQVRSPRDGKIYGLFNTGLTEIQGTFSVATLIENLLSHTETSGEVLFDPAEYADNDILKCEINGAKFEWNKANSQSTLFNYCAAGLIKADLDRGNQKILWTLERPLDILVQDGAAGTPTTQAVYDFVTQLVGLTGIAYKGATAESNLPQTGNTHGDLYVLSDFDLSYPDENIIGLALYNTSGVGEWNKVPIRWLQPDGVTIYVNPLGQTAVKPGSITRPLVSQDIIQDLSLAQTSVQPADVTSLVTLHTAQSITEKKIFTIEPEIPSKAEPADSTRTTSPASEAQVAQKQNTLSGAGLVEYTPVTGIVTERHITDATAPRTLDGSSENAVTERAIKAALPQINDAVNYNSSTKLYGPAEKSNPAHYLGGQLQWVTPDHEPAAGSSVLITSGAVYQALADSVRTWTTLTGKPFESLEADGFSVNLSGMLKNELSDRTRKLDHTMLVSLTGAVEGSVATDLSGTTLTIAAALETISTPGTHGETSDKTLANGDAFKVLTVTTDDKGRITNITEKVMTLSVQLPAVGTAGAYGETTDRSIKSGDAFTVLEITTDDKGRITSINPRTLTLTIGDTNVYTGNLYHNQYINTGIKLVTNESFSFQLHGESVYLDFHSRWGEAVPLSWLGNIYPEHTFSYSEDRDGFLWLNWKDKTIFSGRELLVVFGRIEGGIIAADAEPDNLARSWESYDNSHQIFVGGGGSGGALVDQIARLMAQAARNTADNHMGDTQNPHSVTKAQLGLGNADNTSDEDKPLSTAQQAGLNAEAEARQNGDAAVLGDAKDYTDEALANLVQPVSYRGTIPTESALPGTGSSHGEYYEVEDLDLSAPGMSGRVIWNTLTQPSQWDIRVDRQREADGVTLGFRGSDGALEVRAASLSLAKLADVSAADIIPDTSDYGDSISGTFAEVFRSIVKKIRGLFASLSGFINRVDGFASAAQGSKADNAVQKTGNETIDGVKTFTAAPAVPSALSLPETVSDTKPATEAQVKQALDAFIPNPTQGGVASDMGNDAELSRYSLVARVKSSTIPENSFWSNTFVAFTLFHLLRAANGYSSGNFIGEGAVKLSGNNPFSIHSVSTLPLENTLSSGGNIYVEASEYPDGAGGKNILYDFYLRKHINGGDSNTCYANILVSGAYTDDNITNQNYEVEYFRTTDNADRVLELRNTGDTASRPAILGAGADGIVTGNARLDLM